MKLSTALAVLIAIQRHGHRMMCVLASVDDHERKLRINQADAAKRVNDAVELAKASVDAGDVHGVALPLNYVHLSAGQQQLTVALRLPGVDRDQHIMIDTGSSSLAFCNKSLAEEATDITKTEYATCSKFGLGAVSCPDDTSVTGYNSGFVGQVFQGNIAAYDMSNGKEIASMYDIYFNIVERVQNYMCFGPLDGIIGVAYTTLNDVVEIPSPDFDVVSLWKQFCESDDPLYLSIGNCIPDILSMDKIQLPSPLEQSLKWGVDSGYDSVEAFGLYCDYAATIDSEKDAIIPSLGAYFGGDVALNNTFYNSGTPQIAFSPKCENESKYYNLNLKAISIPGLDNTPYSGFNQCKDFCGKCVTDSGSSYIFLPLPQSVCNDAKSTDASNLKELGPMLLDLEGVNGSTITLSLPLHWLVDLVRSDLVICTYDNPPYHGEFILGLPIFQYYYLVYDMGNNTVTFVDLQLSKTEAFDPSSSPSKSSEPPSQPMDGPEKEPGKISEPSTGYRHTGGLGTNTFVVAGLFMLACKYIF